MIDLSPLFSTGCAVVLAFLGEIALKATAVLLAVGCLDLLLGRQRPLARSSLWHAALAALAILPFAALFMPPLAIFPERVPDKETATRPGAATGPLDAATPLSIADGPVAAKVPLVATDVEEATLDWNKIGAGSLLAIYLLGCVVLAIRFATSLRAVVALTSAAKSVVDERWTALLDHWRRQLAIGRRVRLLVSPEVFVPVEIGWLRPAILLPPRVAASNSNGTREAVLVHELGHVRRADYGWNLLLRVLSIMYWPHPLIWLAARRVCQLREQACDDLCIHWLGGAAAYRTQLIELTAELLLGRPSVALGIAMSQPTKIARRLEWIDNSVGRPECLAPALARRSLFAATLLVAGALGAATGVRSVAHAQDSDHAAADERTLAAAKSPEEKPNAGPQATAPVTAPAEKDAATAKDQSEEPSDDRPVRVRAERVKRGDFIAETSQPCNLIAGRTTVVYTRVPGFVKRMAVEMGDRVKKGQVLAELEVSEFAPEIVQAEAAVAEAEAEHEHSLAVVREEEATLMAAEADLEKANGDLEGTLVALDHRRKQYERIRKFVEEKSVDSQLADEVEERLSTAQSAVKAAKSRVESAKALARPHEAAISSAHATAKLAEARARVAEAKLDGVKRRVEATRIVSPFDGVVIERFAHVGDYASATHKHFPICTVAGLWRMTAVVQVPELDALKVQPGAAARVLLDALPGKVFAAKVSRVAYNIDTKTRSLRVEIDLNNTLGRLLPGMVGAAAVVIGEHRDALSIPRSAFYTSPSSALTFADGRGVLKPIEAGQTSFDRWEVISGLKEGDLVITGLADSRQKSPDWRRRPRVEIVEPAAE